MRKTFREISVAPNMACDEQHQERLCDERNDDPSLSVLSEWYTAEDDITTKLFEYASCTVECAEGCDLIKLTNAKCDAECNVSRS